MKILRPYDHLRDAEAVVELLTRSPVPETGAYRNWPVPRWHYMHYHPAFVESGLIDEQERFTVVEEAGRIVAIAHAELFLGEAYIQRLPGTDLDLEELILRAEDQLKADDTLRFIVPATDRVLARHLEERGYIQVDTTSILAMDLDQLPGRQPLPAGYRLTDLTRENRIGEIARVMYRGFGNGEEPPATRSTGLRLMQMAPGFDRALQSVVVAPDGHYVSYAGLWHETGQNYGYVEPVVSDPGHRKLGLARAALLHSLESLRSRGAKRALVDSDLSFYRDLGFAVVGSWLVYRRLQQTDL